MRQSFSLVEPQNGCYSGVSVASSNPSHGKNTQQKFETGPGSLIVLTDQSCNKRALREMKQFIQEYKQFIEEYKMAEDS